MKKIYLAIFAILAASMPVCAQLTLTKAVHSPVVGDVVNYKEYDSTAVVPKNIGLAQTWNFSAMTSTQNAYATTYTSTSSTPASSLFPGADLVRMSAGNDVDFLNVGGSNYEFLGNYKPSGPEIMNFTNTAVMMAWPVASTNNYSDVVSGSITSGTTVIAVLGTISYTASGTGTVILPGSVTHTNCLQVIQSVSIVIGTGTNATNYSHIAYSYYSSQTKHPVAEVQYEKEVSGGNTTKSFRASFNTIGMPAGLTDNMNEGTQLSVYPNPASDNLTIHLNGVVKMNKAVMYDLTGKVVLETAQNKIDVSTLEPSVYLLKVITDKNVITKRIVVNH